MDHIIRTRHRALKNFCAIEVHFIDYKWKKLLHCREIAKEHSFFAPGGLIEPVNKQINKRTLSIPNENADRRSERSDISNFARAEFAKFISEKLISGRRS